jgi:hypothetical protein
MNILVLKVAAGFIFGFKSSKSNKKKCRVIYNGQAMPRIFPQAFYT